MSIHFEITGIKGGDQPELLARSGFFQPMALQFYEFCAVFEKCIFEVWDKSADGPSYPVIEIKPPLMQTLSVVNEVTAPPHYAIAHEDGAELFSSDSMCNIVSKWNE